MCCCSNGREDERGKKQGCQILYSSGTKIYQPRRRRMCRNLLHHLKYCESLHNHFLNAILPDRNFAMARLCTKKETMKKQIYEAAKKKKKKGNYLRTMNTAGLQEKWKNTQKKKIETMRFFEMANLSRLSAEEMAKQTSNDNGILHTLLSAAFADAALSCQSNIHTATVVSGAENSSSLVVAVEY